MRDEEEIRRGVERGVWVGKGMALSRSGRGGVEEWEGRSDVWMNADVGSRD